MFHKCAMKNLHIRTLFYITFVLHVGATQLPLVCTHSDGVLELQSNTNCRFSGLRDHLI